MKDVNWYDFIMQSVKAYKQLMELMVATERLKCHLHRALDRIDNLKSKLNKNELHETTV